MISTLRRSPLSSSFNPFSFIIGNTFFNISLPGPLINSDVNEKKFKEILNLITPKQFEKIYADYAPLSKQYDYFSECLWGIDGFRMANSFTNVLSPR